MMLYVRSILIAITLLAAVIGGIAPIALGANGRIDHAAVERLLDDGDHDRALELLRQRVEQSPFEAEAWYLKARALARLEQQDHASNALIRAVENGFRDFDRLADEPDLAPIRTAETFEAVESALERSDERRARASLRNWEERFGTAGYRRQFDSERRLIYLTALPEDSHEEMRTMIERQIDHLAETLFDAPPDYEVLIVVPTPEHARRIIDRDEVGGMYDHQRRTLIARDIGVTLRHELVHLMHYGHMERLDQQHPLWIQEGLATLYEDFEWKGDRKVRFRRNERHNVIRQRVRRGLAAPWREMFSLSASRFMARAQALYPQARSIFEFLAEEGLLDRWYESYVDNFENDPDGPSAFEAVFNQPLDQIERRWRTWVRHQPAIDRIIQSGDASLGIESRPYRSADGVLVTRVLSGSGAESAGLRPGDVILAIDGDRTATFEELRRLISKKQAGERVRVRYRRDRKVSEAEATLRPLEYHR